MRNWLALGEEIEVVVVGGEPGIAEICEELDIRHFPNVRCNAMGTPLISSIFELAREVNDSPYLVYSNADILFLPELIDVVRRMGEYKKEFLGVGQRWDLDVDQSIDFNQGWSEALMDDIHIRGKLHGQTGSDYFIFPRTCFINIPDFAVGRAGWDNWMIYHARWQHWPLIDLSKTLTVVHQNHDYRHLPGGQMHYTLPETADNIRMGGGRRTIFNLTEATHQLADGRVERRRLDWRSFWREVEIFPLVSLHSRFLGWLSFAYFHPLKAYNEIKGWLAYKLKKQ